MNEEETVLLIELSIATEDLEELEDMLSRSKMIILGNYTESTSIKLTNYIAKNTLHNTKFGALFDRNLISSLNEVARIHETQLNPQKTESMRLATAAVAFCIHAEILIETNIATFEYAANNNNEAVLEDIKFFRIIDNSDPALLVDVALGRISRLPIEHINLVQEIIKHSLDSIRGIDFNKKIRNWKINYIYVLKVVSLKRNGLSSKEIATAIIKWQAEDFISNVVASFYCLSAISHNPPKGKMIKGIDSTDVKKLKKGIENAVWDICLIQHFRKLTREPNGVFWSLWSLDVALLFIANTLVNETEDKMSIFFQKCWGKDGEFFKNLYFSKAQDINFGSNERKNTIKEISSQLDKNIYELESMLGINT